MSNNSNIAKRSNILNKRILVTGGAGFLGSWVVQKLLERGVPQKNIFIPRSKDYDLTKWENCQKVVKDRDIVIHVAGNAGGIGYNVANPGRLFYDNIMMGTQLMETARLAEVEKFVSVGTICSYPKYTPVPFKEAFIWNGYPEETNAPYGLAKKMQLVQAQAYRKQYGFNAVYILPVNLYGPRDNFKTESSHVVPALIKKVSDAKNKGQKYIDVWGTGKASREFLYVEDCAEGILLATEKYNKPGPVNLGTNREIKIKDLVKLICKIMDFKGEIHWDKTKPDGQPKRRVDSTLARKEFGFKAKTDFEKGLEETIEWYKTSQKLKIL